MLCCSYRIHIFNQTTKTRLKHDSSTSTIHSKLLHYQVHYFNHTLRSQTSLLCLAQVVYLCSGTGPECCITIISDLHEMKRTLNGIMPLRFRMRPALRRGGGQR